MKQLTFALIAVATTSLAVSSMAQSDSKKMEEIAATALYDAFRGDGEKATNKYGMKTMQISGVAVRVGPDVFGLPSVEMASKDGESCKVLCVLPFTDYLKLRKVSKHDHVVMQGEVRGFSAEHDLVVVKQSKIVSVNGEKQ